MAILSRSLRSSMACSLKPPQHTGGPEIAPQERTLRIGGHNLKWGSYQFYPEFIGFLFLALCIRFIFGIIWFFAPQRLRHRRVPESHGFELREVVLHRGLGRHHGQNWMAPFPGPDRGMPVLHRVFTDEPAFGFVEVPKHLRVNRVFSFQAVGFYFFEIWFFEDSTPLGGSFNFRQF